MSIYDNLNAPNTPNALQALEQLKANPMSVLKSAGMNIPDGMTNPQQIVNHLLQTGQVSNPRLQMAQRMMGMFRK